jgi:hypothetical protein
MTQCRLNVLGPPKPLGVIKLLRVVLLAMTVTGCHSLNQPGSASFASVVIAGRSTTEIQDATAAVFRANGYAGHNNGSGQMVFEKEGTRANNLAYNGIVGTHYGAQTIVRVKTDLLDLGGGSQRLQCQAYMVRNAGDSFFEEEQRLANVRRGPYQTLLDEVAKRLK